jgi:hypothetical protein
MLLPNFLMGCRKCLFALYAQLHICITNYDIWYYPSYPSVFENGHLKAVFAPTITSWPVIAHPAMARRKTMH